MVSNDLQWPPAQTIHITLIVLPGSKSSQVAGCRKAIGFPFQRVTDFCSIKRDSVLRKVLHFIIRRVALELNNGPF